MPGLGRERPRFDSAASPWRPRGRFAVEPELPGRWPHLAPVCVLSWTKNKFLFEKFFFLKLFFCFNFAFPFGHLGGRVILP